MKITFFATAALLVNVLPLSACAELTGQHLGYQHALTELRAARWNLEHRAGDAAISGREDIAIIQIDRAIGEIKKAATDDGKDLNNHPQEDSKLDHSGRLHHALALLKKALGYLAGEENNPQNLDLKHHSAEHVDAAISATEQVIHDVEKHNKMKAYILNLKNGR